MSLTTYQNLLDAIDSWLGNTLAQTVGPDLVVLFEAYANRTLRTRQMEAETTITITNGEGSLPADFLAIRKVCWPGSTRVDLEYVTPAWLDKAYPDSTEGTPNVYTLEGSTIKVRPVDDTSLEFLYWEKIDALSGTVNWLYAAHPDAYLFGALAEAESFLVNDNRIALWKARRDEVCAEIQRLSNVSKAPSGSYIRPTGPTP